MRLFLSTLSLLLLAAIVWVTLATLPQMNTVSWLLVVGCWLLVPIANGQLPITYSDGCRLLVVGCRFQRPITNHQ